MMETESIEETNQIESAEGTTPEEITQEDLTDIHDLSDEQLDKLLSGEYEAEAAPEPEEPQGEQPVEAKTESTATEPEAQNDSEKKAVDSDYIKKLEERLAHNERYIKARNQEIGQLRKELRDKNKSLEDQLSDEAFLADPKNAIDARLQMRENEKELEALDHEEAASVAILNNQRVVHSHIPPEEFDIEGMVRCLEQDGVPPAAIKAFAENPFLAENPVTVIQLHKRAKLEQNFLKLAAITKKLIQEKEALEKKPRELLQTVSANLRKPSSVSAKTGGSSKAKTLALNEFQIHNLSDSELDAYLKESA